MSKNLEISVLFDYYGGMLTDKQRDVIDLYYNQDLSLAEIAEHEKISRQGVRDNIKRGELYLLELENSLHMVKMSQALFGLLDEIDQRNAAVASLNEENRYSGEIREHTAEIASKIHAFVKEYE